MGQINYDAFGLKLELNMNSTNSYNHIVIDIQH